MEWSHEYNLVIMNLSGRFNNSENRIIGQHVVTQIIMEKNVALFFGQQSSFIPTVPAHYKVIGLKKAFLVYNKSRFLCKEEAFNQKLRDLQKKEKFPQHYLSYHNYAACILTSVKRMSSKLSFIALSWVTDEAIGQTKCISTFKKLMTFVRTLSEYESLPIIVGGSFRITPDEAVKWLPDGYKCYSYRPETPRRAARAASFYITSSSILMESIIPLACGNIDAPRSTHTWVNPEGALYCDPVLATVIHGQYDDYEDVIVYEPRDTAKKYKADVIKQNGVSNRHNTMNGHKKYDVNETKANDSSNPDNNDTEQNGGHKYFEDKNEKPSDNDSCGEEEVQTIMQKHSDETNEDETDHIDSDKELAQASRPSHIPVRKTSFEALDTFTPCNLPRAISWSGSLYDEEEINKNTSCYMS